MKPTQGDADQRVENFTEVGEKKSELHCIKWWLVNDTVLYFENDQECRFLVPSPLLEVCKRIHMLISSV